MKILTRPRSYDLYTISEVFDSLSYYPSLGKRKKDFEVVLDLGAGIGDFSLWAYKFLHPRKIIAVEMEGNNFENLCLNIKRNRLEKVITPVKIAIAEREGKMGITFNDFNVGMHRLNFRQKKGTKTRTISLGKLLDNYQLKNIDLLKMDIEGAERFILNEENKGLFKEKISYAIIESHLNHERNANYLVNLGFEVKIKKQLFNRAVMIEALKVKTAGE